MKGNTNVKKGWFGGPKVIGNITIR